MLSPFPAPVLPPTFLRSMFHLGLCSPAAPIPRALGRAECCPRGEPAPQHCAHIHTPCAPSLFLSPLCSGAPGRAQGRQGGALPSPGGGGAAHLRPSPRRRGGGAARARGGAASTPLPPAGLGHLRAGRCERQRRRDGGRDPRPGAGAHRAAAAEPLPRRWEPRARAGAEPRGAGVGTGGGGENFGAGGPFHGAAPRRGSGGSPRCAWHRPALPLWDAPPGEIKSFVSRARLPGAGRGAGREPLRPPPPPRPGCFDNKLSGDQYKMSPRLSAR